MKTRLFAVLLVSTLVLATTAPLALAQATAENDRATAGEASAEDDRDNGNANITIVDCSQVQNAFVQGQYGNANASEQYDGDAIAVVAQELDISQDQVNSCLVNVGGDGDGNGDGDGDTDAADDEAADTKKEDVMASTVPEVEELPETGGASLLALGFGGALVAGGASLIRFRR